MNNQEIKAIIETRPESVIAAAIRFNPQIKEQIESARAVKPEAIISLAATAMREALTTYGHSPAEAGELMEMVK